MKRMSGDGVTEASAYTTVCTSGHTNCTHSSHPHVFVMEVSTATRTSSFATLKSIWLRAPHHMLLKNTGPPSAFKKGTQTQVKRWMDIFDEDRFNAQQHSLQLYRCTQREEEVQSTLKVSRVWTLRCLVSVYALIFIRFFSSSDGVRR